MNFHSVYAMQHNHRVRQVCLEPPFAHGQLCVGASRVEIREDILVLTQKRNILKAIVPSSRTLCRMADCMDLLLYRCAFF